MRRITRGFLEGAQGSLTPTELEYLPWGARLMTLECGIRFLTDYLEGDHYFRIHYPEQNLDRTRTQFKLVSDMETQFDRMAAVVAGYVCFLLTDFQRRSIIQEVRYPTVEAAGNACHCEPVVLRAANPNLNDCRWQSYP